MITRIELTNFMSHASTVIEPAPGLTVLTGPNNCGKSAVVAALQILCHNENSTYVLRHGEKECTVKVETDDGHVVEWRRRNSPSYTVDGKLFDRLRGAGLPEELHAALRLPRVDAGNEADFDVHFGSQKAPVFLLGSSPANAARFFASSSDAIRLVQMQRRHKEKVSAARADQNRLEAEAKQLNDELECLEPVADLDLRLTEAEAQFGELKLQADNLDEGIRHVAAMERQGGVVEQHAACLGVLNNLAAPPAMEASEPLAQLISILVSAAAQHAQGRLRTESLQPLAAPPQMEETAGLAGLAQQIAAAESAVQRCQQRDAALRLVTEPPTLANDQELSRLLFALAAADGQLAKFQQQSAALETLLPVPEQGTIAPLEEFIGRLQRVSQELGQCEMALETVSIQLQAAEESLRLAAAQSLCDTCGAPLDPQRVVERAAAGLGGHDHGE